MKYRVSKGEWSNKQRYAERVRYREVTNKDGQTERVKRVTHPSQLTFETFLPLSPSLFSFPSFFESFSIFPSPPWTSLPPLHTPPLHTPPHIFLTPPSSSTGLLSPVSKLRDTLTPKQRVARRSLAVPFHSISSPLFTGKGTLLLGSTRKVPLRPPALWLGSPSLSDTIKAGDSVPFGRTSSCHRPSQVPPGAGGGGGGAIDAAPSVWLVGSCVCSPLSPYVSLSFPFPSLFVSPH